MSETNGYPSDQTYTLQQARTALSQGIRFGDIYPNLINPDDGEALKAFFVHGYTNDTPLPIPTKESMIALKSCMSTGEFCTECGGVMMRTGTCRTCTNCGWNGGCG